MGVGMGFPIYDDDGNVTGEAPGKTVTCEADGCENKGVPIEVPDYPSGVVMCGPCGAVL